jgi:hypothetical protein
MPNRAERLYDLYSDAQEVGSKRSNNAALNVWAEVFGFAREVDAREVKTDAQALNVQRMLVLTTDELDKLEKQAMGLGWSARSYENFLGRARSVLLPRRVNKQWHSFHQSQLDGSVLQGLSMLSDQLSDEEVGLSEEEVRDYSNDLKSLRGRLDQSDATPAFKQFVAGAIDILKAATHSYRVEGVEAFRRARRQMEHHAAAFKNTRDTEETSEEEVEIVNSLNGYIATMMNWADKADTIYALAQAGQGLLPAGGG